MPARPTTPSPALRGWQEQALARMRAWTQGTFLVSAAPGAGKTIPSIVFARELLAAGAIKRVVVACPTAPLTRQWAGAAARLGVQLQPDAPDAHPPRGFHGVAVTYARIASWTKAAGEDTLVVADEAHHLGDDLAWGLGFSRTLGRAGRVLLLSGTPFRSDATPIPGVRYEDGLATPDFSYTYADAVRDGICRPVTFIPYDGVLQWKEGDETIESSFSDALAGRHAARRYRTAISTELPDGLPRILRQAHERLSALRAGDHEDAGGLVIAADGTHAKAVAKVLRELTGRAPTVVLHTEQRAAEKLAAFTKGADPWIVAVNMVSEGVDIPRLRVGVYATAAKTPLIFRQIVGRFVRTIPGRPIDMSWLYLPADPVLRRHAGDVETELRHFLKAPAEGDPLELDEVPDQLATEPGEKLVFEPVAADVAPQLELFGPTPDDVAGQIVTSTAAASAASIAPEAPTAPPLDTGFSLQAPPGPEPSGTPLHAPGTALPDVGDEVPAYERRALLRDKRHRLVAELRRIDGRTHAEINAWLNGRTGVRRVEDATLDQLDRSIALLLEELPRAARRRPAGRGARGRAPARR